MCLQYHLLKENINEWKQRYMELKNVGNPMDHEDIQHHAKFVGEIVQ